MRKKILGFVFAAALLAAMAVPLFGGQQLRRQAAHGDRMLGDVGREVEGGSGRREGATRWANPG